MNFFEYFAATASYADIAVLSTFALSALVGGVIYISLAVKFAFANNYAVNQELGEDFEFDKAIN